jgi:hypothetical protein
VVLVKLAELLLGDIPCLASVSKGEGVELVARKGSPCA